MNRIPERNRPLVVVLTGVAVLLVVVGGILVASRLAPSPTPTPSSAPASPSPSADGSTPEGATRSFFDAVVAARRIDDPALIEPFVTSSESSAYRTIAGFLAGQKERGRASITTKLDLEGIEVEESGDNARLTATLREAGYDIDIDTGEALESLVTLAPRDLTVELRRIDGLWKVDSFETRA